MASVISAGTTSGTSLNLSADTSGVLQLATNGTTTAVTIDTSQNVGIGTASPTVKLDVTGSLKVTNSSGSTIVANRTSNPGSFELQHSGVQTAQFSAISGGGLEIYTGSSPGLRMSVNAYGIGLGTAVPSSGTGITFPATQSASSDANCLDDYEEGTFEATLTCSTSGTITIATENLCSYTKIGRMVHVCGQLQVSAVSSPVGFINLNGLPFAVANNSSPDFQTRTAPSLFVSSVTSANVSDFIGFAFEGQTSLRIYLGNGTTSQSTSAQQMQIGTTIIFSLSYVSA